VILGATLLKEFRTTWQTTGKYTLVLNLRAEYAQQVTRRDFVWSSTDRMAFNDIRIGHRVARIVTDRFAIGFYPE